jgi:hypothetical protein
VNICKVCGYGPCKVTEIPLRCLAQCEKAVASVVKRNFYRPIKGTQRLLTPFFGKKGQKR